MTVQATRHNFYHAIHKAIRFGHCRMLSAIGSNDFAQRQPTVTLLADLRLFLMLGKGHLDGENREIHTALEARAPGASAHAAEDHDGHDQSFIELEEMMRRVEAATDEGRPAAGAALYHRYAMFMAHDIEHMNEEETELLSVLQANFTDPELQEIEGRIVSAIPPQKMAYAMSLMIPALNHGERVDLLSKLEKALPAAAFQGLLSSTIKQSLAAADYASLAALFMKRAA